MVFYVLYFIIFKLFFVIGLENNLYVDFILVIKIKKCCLKKGLKRGCLYIIFIELKFVFRKI